MMRTRALFAAILAFALPGVCFAIEAVVVRVPVDGTSVTTSYLDRIPVPTKTPNEIVIVNEDLTMQTVPVQGLTVIGAAVGTVGGIYAGDGVPNTFLAYLGDEWMQTDVGRPTGTTTSMAASPDGRYVAWIDFARDSLNLVDTSSRTHVLEYQPQEGKRAFDPRSGLAFNSDGDLAVAGTYVDKLYVFDPDLRTIEKTITMPAGSRPYGVAGWGSQFEVTGQGVGMSMTYSCTTTACTARTKFPSGVHTPLGIACDLTTAPAPLTPMCYFGVQSEAAIVAYDPSRPPSQTSYSLIRLTENIRIAFVAATLRAMWLVGVTPDFLAEPEFVYQLRRSKRSSKRRSAGD